MAIVGQSLTTPEAGWRRYDDIDSRLLYNGNLLVSSNSGYYGGNIKFVNNDESATISFKFFGSKLRIINIIDDSYWMGNKVLVDGIEYTTATGNSSQIYCALTLEILDLSLGFHTVIMSPGLSTTNRIGLDAIDIDDTGYLVHPILNQKTNINDMEIGDVIPCKYTATTSGTIGAFSELGTCIANEIPITGSSTPNGLFYFIKVDTGKLIADRVVQTNITWDTLNSNRVIEGKNFKYGIELNGTTSYAFIPYNTNLLPANLLTLKVDVECDDWTELTKTDLTYGRTIIANYEVGGYGISGSSVRQTLMFQVYSNGDYRLCEMPISYFTPGRHEIVGTFDGRYLKMYVDKVLAKTLDVGSITTITYMSNVPLALGVNPNATAAGIDLTGGYAKCKIYEVSIFNKCLMQEDINNIDIISNGLIGKWNFSEGIGTTIKDIGPYKVNGKLYNCNWINDPLYAIKIRSIFGGISYKNIYNESTLTNSNLGGWPIDNEWDTYIVNSDLNGKIVKGDDNIWHYKTTMQSWCIETPILGTWNSGSSTSTPTNNNRIMRGYRSDSWNDINFAISTMSRNTEGFRPVLEYKETSSKATNLYY